ncbi:MAG: hypothetical protein ABEJ66_00560, partial [Candidatus Nanohaloarchaea archaeon]
MLEKIKSMFTQEPVQVEELENAPEKYREVNQDELDTAEKRVEEFAERTEQALEELRGFLEDLEDYDDSQDRPIVEDVVDNVAGDRLKLIQEQEVP